MTRAAPQTAHRSEQTALCSLLELRPGAERPVASGAEAVAQGLAVAKVYAFASVDYPGAAISQVYDSDGTTAVGAFDFDPGGIAQTTAFTFRAAPTRSSLSRTRPRASPPASTRRAS
jgi:hypothetical protein